MEEDQFSVCSAPPPLCWNFWTASTLSTFSGGGHCHRQGTEAYSVLCGSVPSEGLQGPRTWIACVRVNPAHHVLPTWWGLLSESRTGGSIPPKGIHSCRGSLCRIGHSKSCGSGELWNDPTLGPNRVRPPNRWHMPGQRASRGPWVARLMCSWFWPRLAHQGAMSPEGHISAIFLPPF